MAVKTPVVKKKHTRHGNIYFKNRGKMLDKITDNILLPFVFIYHVCLNIVLGVSAGLVSWVGETGDFSCFFSFLLKNNRRGILIKEKANRRLDTNIHIILWSVYV